MLVPRSTPAYAIRRDHKGSNWVSVTKDIPLQAVATFACRLNAKCVFHGRRVYRAVIHENQNEVRAHLCIASQCVRTNQPKREKQKSQVVCGKPHDLAKEAQLPIASPQPARRKNCK